MITCFVINMILLLLLPSLVGVMILNHNNKIAYIIRMIIITAK